MHRASPSDITPAERRRLRVRDAILDAAESVFAEEGEEGLSIRRLAEAIDYSPAAIYKYFGSKEELIDELKNAFFARLLERIDGIIGQGLPFPERARQCMTSYICTALEKPHHYAAAYSGTMDMPEAGADCAPVDWEAFVADNKGKAFAHLLELVRVGQADGYFRTGTDPVLAAHSLWASMHGLALLISHMPAMIPLPDDEGRPVDRDRLIDFHADQVVRGLEVGSFNPAGLDPTDTD